MKSVLLKTFMVCLGMFFFFGCSKDDINNILNGDSDKVVSALKSALEIGAKNSVTKLSAENGYLGDEAVKILLPQEAQTTFEVIQIISKNPAVKVVLSGLDIQADFGNTLTTLINKAAEDAAPKATDIFVSAIKNITIADGESILFGADNAATQYLSDKTYTSLQSAFEPSITASLNTVSVQGYTANSAWEFYAEQNNKLADLIQKSSSAIGLLQTTGVISADVKNKISSVKSVQTNLANYATAKALDGLFTKIAGEEYKIRTDVTARTTSLLQEIFGRLDAKN